MRRRSDLLASAALLAILGCGDGGAGPDGGDGQRLAAQFERLADSVAGAGYSPTAEALRHAADIVRLTGHATPVRLTIDGTSRDFLAVAEQIDFPSLVCSWPADSGVAVPADSVIALPQPVSEAEGECTVVGTHSMRTLIAWEPERLAEVVRIVADIGSGAVQPGVPDVMVDLPAAGTSGGTPVAPVSDDSAGGGLAWYPGFFGEYLVRDVGTWWSVEGSQTNTLEGTAGTCTTDRAVFDWAEFTCEALRIRFEFDMRVEPLRYEPLAQWIPGGEPPPNGAEGSHTLSLPESIIDGVKLAVVAWTPPPLPSTPPTGSLPGDSTVVDP